MVYLEVTEEIVSHPSVHHSIAEGITEWGLADGFPIGEPDPQTPYCKNGVVEGVDQIMERFFSALSITLMLMGLSALTQIQPSRSPIDQVVNAGLMSRFPNGDFRANETINRAELARILVKTFHLDRRHSEYETMMPIEDVPASHWAYLDIQIVLRDRIMTGYGEGRFRPDQRITRAEAFAIFAQAQGVYQFPEQTIREVLAPYSDAAEIPDWARKSMATALYEGYVNLKSNDQIAPLSPMTRGDMAYTLNLYLKRQNSSAVLSLPMTNQLRLHQIFSQNSGGFSIPLTSLSDPLPMLVATTNSDHPKLFDRWGNKALPHL